MNENTLILSNHIFCYLSYVFCMGMLINVVNRDMLIYISFFFKIEQNYFYSLRDLTFILTLIDVKISILV